MCVLNFSRNSRPPVQKELELDFRAGISSCRAEEVHGVMVALHATPADVRHQLAAARAKAAQAVAAHRSCQTDFLRLERMFNEVVPNSPLTTLELFCAAVCSRHTCRRSCRKTTSCVRARCSDFRRCCTLAPKRCGACWQLWALRCEGKWGVHGNKSFEK